jgi:CubicO group peptidase (beta-lactamase class C family)
VSVGDLTIRARVVVKRATKKSLAEFAKQNIFQPLGFAELSTAHEELALKGRNACETPNPTQTPPGS